MQPPQCSKDYLTFGTRVRRRQTPGEPGDGSIGWVAGGSLDGRKTFVMFGKGPRRKMELLPSDEIETVSERKA
jgi:hypothetical protein